MVSVNREKGFAMIRTGVELAPGAELQSRSAQNNAPTATLRVSSEQFPPHVIVDIMKGKPFPGEIVTRLAE